MPNNQKGQGTKSKKSSNMDEEKNVKSGRNSQGSESGGQQSGTSSQGNRGKSGNESGRVGNSGDLNR